MVRIRRHLTRPGGRVTEGPLETLGGDCRKYSRAIGRSRLPWELYIDVGFNAQTKPS